MKGCGAGNRGIVHGSAAVWRRGALRAGLRQQVGQGPSHLDRIFPFLAKLVPGLQTQGRQHALGQVGTPKGQLALERGDPLVLAVGHAGTVLLAALKGLFGSTACSADGSW